MAATNTPRKNHQLVKWTALCAVATVSVLVSAQSVLAQQQQPQRQQAQQSQGRPATQQQQPAPQQAAQPAQPVVGRGFVIKTPDGVTVNAQDWGNQRGPVVVLIHDQLQNHQIWARQINSELAREFRLITWDLRGHGSSEKPLDAQYYSDSGRYADELKWVLDGLGVASKPVLVGWGYGTRVIADYMKKHGATNLAGAMFVSPDLSSVKEATGPAGRYLQAQGDGALQDLLNAAFVRRPAREEMDQLRAVAATVPPEVRRAMQRPTDYEPWLKAQTIPVLITYGAQDTWTLPVQATWLASIVPGARESAYEGVGHAPPIEDAARFNAELTAFVRDAMRGPAPGTPMQKSAAPEQPAPAKEAAVQQQQPAQQPSKTQRPTQQR